MIAIQFRKSIPRYLALRAVGRRFPGQYTGLLGMVSARDLPEPKLPTPQWVRIQPGLSGICGSDLSTICAKGTPYFSPLSSTPFVLGHEVVGRVTEVGADARRFSVGDRVVIQPALGCRVRGIEKLCDACAVGQLALCRNVTRGDISSGIQTGFCRDTGGAWSESLVAHESQLYLVPDSIDDTAAVLAEPLACAIHAVQRSRKLRPPSGPQPSGVGPKHSALVMGCGAIGLLVIAALRALGRPLRIVALAKYQHQADFARRFGADEVLIHDRDVKRRYAALSKVLRAELHQPEIGKPTVIGGAAVTFDCVASSASIDDCCRFTTARGELILVGMPAVPKNIDWTTIWYKELAVKAAYAYGTELHNGKKRATFELSLDMLAKCAADLRPLVGEPFALTDHKQAIQTALHTGTNGSIKTIFRVQSGPSGR